jgi:transposase
MVQAIAWHLRVGGGWRALPPDMPPWRTVYSWFRRWQALGLFERMMRDLARLRRRTAGQKPRAAAGHHRHANGEVTCPPRSVPPMM